MAFSPPPGPFGSGGTPVGGPPGGSAPFGSGRSLGGPPVGGGGIVVHRARLVPRMLLVLGLVGVSFAVTGLVIWVAVLGTADDVARASRAGTRATTPGVTTAIGPEVAPPDGWPAALAPPAGATVLSSVASAAGTADEQLVMVVEVGGEGAAVADDLRAQLTAAGLVITTDTAGAGGTGTILATGSGWDATVATTPDPARPGIVTVSWVLRPGLR